MSAGGHAFTLSRQAPLTRSSVTASIPKSPVNASCPSQASLHERNESRHSPLVSPEFVPKTRLEQCVFRSHANLCANQKHHQPRQQQIPSCHHNARSSHDKHH